LIHFVAETGSTNADLFARAAAAEGEWLVARRQSAGRGRTGRTWNDGAGNFMGSTVARLGPGDPPPQTLALVSGLAVFETVAALPEAPAGLMLKWPNDLLVRGAKLAGVLLEREGARVVVGIGVNLARAPDLAERSTASLAAAPPLEDFAGALAATFAALLARWHGGDWPALRQAWLACAHPEGTRLSVHDSGGARVFGTFAGLAADGAALLRLAEGTTRAIHAGDLEMGA
jgi:BirA family transcriptional regulator, biotin operon repressor / biotin---[acetyl-CoA-carboxylase] ligase